MYGVRRCLGHLLLISKAQRATQVIQVTQALQVIQALRVIQVIQVLLHTTLQCQTGSMEQRQSGLRA